MMPNQISNHHDHRKHDKNEEAAFMESFPTLVDKITSHPEHADLRITNEWLGRAMNHIVPNGKKFRGLLVVRTVRHLIRSKREEGLDDEELEQAHVLGWCVEMLHAAHKLKTDIITNQPLSRGTPSWHLSENLGPAAFNDAILLSGAMYYLLKKYFQDEDYYVPLLNIFHEAQLFRSFGHCLEMKTAADAPNLVRHLNLRRYEDIVKYQHGYFSFYFPVAAAMQMCDIPMKDGGRLVEIFCKIGLLSQVLQDRATFNLAMNNSLEMKKPAELLMNWYLFASLQKASTDQAGIIKSYLSGHEGVESVVKIYHQMKLDRAIDIKVNALYNEILSEIKTGTLLDDFEGIPEIVFTDLLKSVWVRC